MSLTSLATPRDWWEGLNAEFGFTVDLAASDEHHLCEKYFTESDSAFDHDWTGVGWCSPPWSESGLGGWVGRAAEQVEKHGSTVVMLLPVREDAPWWGEYADRAELRMIDEPLKFTPMGGDPDRQVLVEPHCLWVLGGENVTEKDKAEAEALEQRVEEISAAFRAAYGPRFEWAWVVKTQSNDVIVNLDDQYFRIGYEYSEDGGYTFADPVKWAQVQRRVTWEEASKAQREAEFGVDACPKKMVKVIKDHGEALHVGAYATIWGELDCDGERMTKEAIQPYVEAGATPLMFWLHGWDPDFGSTLPGAWDGGSFKIDDVGLWVEGTVTHPEAVRRIRETGNIGLSVGSNPKFVHIDEDGNIRDWALLEISIMEGGKQCVPNAYTDMKSNHLELLMGKAREMGVLGENEGWGRRTERARWLALVAEIEAAAL